MLAGNVICLGRGGLREQNCRNARQPQFVVASFATILVNQKLLLLQGMSLAVILSVTWTLRSTEFVMQSV